MSALGVGDLVLLVEGRGCHRLHRLDRWDTVTAEGLSLGAETWRALRFLMDGTVSYWCPVLRCRTPAIGRPEAPYAPLYLPCGWSRPHARWPAPTTHVPLVPRIGVNTRWLIS